MFIFNLGKLQTHNFNILFNFDIHSIVSGSIVSGFCTPDLTFMWLYLHMMYIQKNICAIYTILHLVLFYTKLKQLFTSTLKFSSILIYIQLYVGVLPPWIFVVVRQIWPLCGCTWICSWSTFRNIFVQFIQYHILCIFLQY